MARAKRWSKRERAAFANERAPPTPPPPPQPPFLHFKARAIKRDCSLKLFPFWLE